MDFAMVSLLHASIQARIRLSKIKNERKSTYLLFIIEIFRIFAQVSTTQKEALKQYVLL